MDMRRDASVAAAKIISAVSALPDEIGQGALATTGVIEAHPNSRNVVPERVFMTVDLRHRRKAELARMEQRLETLVAESCAGSGVDAKLERIWGCAPIRFHPDCIAAVGEATRASVHPCREIISGAGHDAVYVSRVAPTAMIFIPCGGGISHNESESAETEHVAAGASVLLGAVLARDRAVGSSGVE
jgi:N-carbamoyl-L-amino-acid hydrolase